MTIICLKTNAMDENIEKTECVLSSVVRIEIWHEHKAGVPEVVRYRIRKVYSNDKLLYEDKMTTRIFRAKEDVFRQLDRFLLGLKESEGRKNRHRNGSKMISFFKILWFKFFG